VHPCHSLDYLVLTCYVLLYYARRKLNKSKTMAATLKNFINGKFVDSLGNGSLPVVNPATEDVICHVPLSTAADVDAAVQAAQAVFPEWSNITIKQVCWGDLHVDCYEITCDGL
jgi:delta 1-pyrroline-5-carboxylate dehydrogenase